MTLNYYTYVENNPLKYIDPSGMSPNDTIVVGDHGVSPTNTIGGKPASELTLQEMGSLLGNPYLSENDKSRIFAYMFQSIFAPDKGGAFLIRDTSKFSKFINHIKITFKGASKDEFVDIYRAVGPDEYYDIMNTNMFRSGPNSLSGKQFGNSFEEILKLTNYLQDTSAIIRARVPISVYNQLDHTRVDSFILKSGSVTVQPNKLNLFNNTLIGIKHIY
jgi:hypothetical protein